MSDNMLKYESYKKQKKRLNMQSWKTGRNPFFAMKAIQ